jgi:metal-responsive CopG/Arc/MetJ family transcriptional regulator
MKKTRYRTGGDYTRVSLCIPESILAKIEGERLPTENRSATLQRILRHVFDRPPWTGSPPRARGVVTVSVTMDRDVLAKVDELRVEGESRSRFVTKMVQFFFNF